MQKERVGNEDLTIINKLKDELGSIINTIRNFSNETKRYSYFIAWLNTNIEAHGLGRVIVTGGFAVELYTGRVYRTMDIDLICEGRSSFIIEELLKGMSERIARGFLLLIEGLDTKSIDIVSTIYSKDIPPIRVKVNDYYLYIEPPETLITTYLAGWKFWNSSEDRDKALWLIASTKPILNAKLLRDLAKKNRVDDKLEELLRLIKEHLGI